MNRSLKVTRSTWLNCWIRRTSLKTSKAPWYRQGALASKDPNFVSMFSPGLFSPSKALNKEYEEYVLTVGDFDERVFLGADADEEIGTPRKIVRDSSSCQKNVQSVEKVKDVLILLSAQSPNNSHCFNTI